MSLPQAVLLISLVSVAASSAATLSVTNTSDSGPGSLRQAILDANASPGADTIAFNIPGPGVHTISLLSALPALTDDAGVTIDGYSQPGSSPNSLAIGDNAVLLIELSGGVFFTEGGYCMSVRSSSNHIRGLVINGCTNGAGFYGVAIGDGSNNVVSGCFLGTDSNGASAKPNLNGVAVDGSTVIPFGAPFHTTIGGTSPSERNLISGNLAGIVLGAGASTTLVMGNYIGTDATGTRIVANGSGVAVNASLSGNIIGGMISGSGNLVSGNSVGIIFGVAGQASVQGNRIGTDPSGVFSVPNGTGVSIADGGTAIIGGSTPQARNLISGNTFNGVRVFRPFFGLPRVEGNFIGTDATGTGPLGNGQNGILIASSSLVYTVGETVTSNVIAFNGAAGVAVGFNSSDGSSNNRISGNSIHDNTGPGIDLGSDGVTPNDAGDTDTGPNNLQNSPVLTSAVSDGISTRVQGSLNSSPNTTFAIQFFANPSCDPSGYGEGQDFLGEAASSTDSAGNTSFQISLPLATAAGQVITATATDPSGNTSEFSPCAAVTFATLPSSVPTLDARHLLGLAIALAAAGALFLGRNR